MDCGGDDYGEFLCLKVFQNNHVILPSFGYAKKIYAKALFLHSYLILSFRTMS